jgi:hypothetical protein
MAMMTLIIIWRMMMMMMIGTAPKTISQATKEMVDDYDDAFETD